MEKSYRGFTLSIFVVTAIFYGNFASAVTVAAGAINVRNKGAVGDGKTDDTAAIQKAVDAVAKDGTVFVPAGKYLIDATKHINLKSNMHFQMDPNATLITKPNGKERYYVINIANKTNVEVFGGNIIGDREKHTGKTGEWGHGVNIMGASSHINVHDMKVSSMWGDGFYVGDVNEYVNYVVIRKVVATNNRRQGLSITNANHVQVLDSEFSYTKGTAPEYGIDVESNRATGARDVLIQNCYIHHNQGGVLAYKNSYGLVLKNNRLTYNLYGFYSVQSYDGQLIGNRIAHNRYLGVAINRETDNYRISGNTFVNNSSKAIGLINPDYNPTVTLVGLSSKTNPHITASKDSTRIKVETNYYRK